MSTIIKANQSGKALHRPLAVDLADHLREAKLVLENARRQAEETITQATSQAQRLQAAARDEAHGAGFREGKELGYKEGHAAGEAAGRQEALAQARAAFEQEHAHLLSDLQRAIAEIEKRKEEIRTDAQRHVLDFAIRLAAKMTYAYGATSQHAVLGNLSRALECVNAKTQLTVRIHPRDVAALEQMAPEELEKLRGGHEVRLVPDDSIARGGCVVRTQQTEVDATLESQMAEIVSLLIPRESADAHPETAP